MKKLLLNGVFGISYAELIVIVCLAMINFFLLFCHSQFFIVAFICSIGLVFSYYMGRSDETGNWQNGLKNILHLLWIIPAIWCVGAMICVLMGETLGITKCLCAGVDAMFFGAAMFFPIREIVLIIKKKITNKKTALR